MSIASDLPLISAEALRASLDAGEPIALIDAGFDLADTAAGEAAWHRGHLPGSIYLHLERDLSGPKIDAQGVFRGRHPLPQRRDFAALLGRFGIGPSTTVVAFDSQGGMYAARVWWMLRWMGHETVAVLDGGTAAWKAAGGTFTTAPSQVLQAAPYPERSSSMPAVTVDELAARLSTVRILDARAGERFRGEVEPLDKAAGHIPGATNRFFKDNLQADGRFKPVEQLRAEFTSLLGRRSAVDTVHQCGSGVTACHNLLAMEHAGLTGSALYPGSWSEWSGDAARPVARGG